MKVLASLLISVALGVATAGAMAQTRVIPGEFTGPNGCGAADGMKVPDSILQCKFKAACNAHDACYSKCMAGGMTAGEPQCEYLRCLPGGDLHGSPLCGSEKYTSLQREAVGRRASCDVQFFEAMTSDNAGYCSVFAGVYQAAVILGGKGNFNGLEIGDRLRLDLEKSPESVERIISNTPRSALDRSLVERLRQSEK